MSESSCAKFRGAATYYPTRLACVGVRRSFKTEDSTHCRQWLPSVLLGSVVMVHQRLAVASVLSSCQLYCGFRRAQVCSLSNQVSIVLACPASLGPASRIANQSCGLPAVEAHFAPDVSDLSKA